MGGAIVVSRDLMMRTRLEDAARAAGHAILSASSDTAPSVVLVDLDADGAMDEVRTMRERFPEARVVAFVSHVDRARWDEASSLGVEVHPRGASTRATAILAES